MRFGGIRPNTLRVLGVGLILSNALLMFLPLAGANAHVRSLDVLAAGGLAWLGLQAIYGVVAIPRDRLIIFVSLFLTVVLVTTAISFGFRSVPIAELNRISLAIGRLVEVLLLGVMLRLLANPDVVRKGAAWALTVTAAIPLSSLYLFASNPVAYTRIAGFVSLGTARGFVDQDTASFNEIGALLGLFFVVSTVLMLNARTWSGRIGYALLAGLYVSGTLLTFSRSAMLGMACAMLVVFAMASNRQRIGIATGLFAAIAGVIAALPAFVTDLAFRFAGTAVAGSQANSSAMARFAGWKSALGLFAESPIFGFGYAAYPVFNHDGFITPENYYLEILADLGLIGTAVWAWYLCSLSVRAWRGWHVASGDPDSSRNAVLRFAIPGVVGLLATNVTGNNFFDPNLLLMFLFLAGAIEVAIAPKPYERIT